MPSSKLVAPTHPANPARVRELLDELEFETASIHDIGSPAVQEIAEGLLVTLSELRAALTDKPVVEPFSTLLPETDAEESTHSSTVPITTETR